MTHQVGETVYVTVEIRAIDPTNPRSGYRGVLARSRMATYFSEGDIISLPTPSTVPASPAFQVGDKVRHIGMPSWGEGTIDHLVMDGNTCRLDYGPDGIEHGLTYTGPWYSVRYANRNKRYISAETNLRLADEVPSFKVGDRVQHVNMPEWGVGKVIEIYHAQDRNRMYTDHTAPGQLYGVATPTQGDGYCVRYPNFMLSTWVSNAEFLVAAPDQPEPEPLKVGDLVTHKYKPNWGKGKILAILPDHRSDADFDQPDLSTSHHIEYDGIWYRVDYPGRGWWSSPETLIVRAK